MLGFDARAAFCSVAIALIAALSGSAAAGAAEKSSGAAAEPCLECHAAAADALDPRFQVDPPSWAASVHGQAGLTCDTCHAGKGDVPHAESGLFQACAECHAGEVEEFAGSVHGHQRNGAKPWPMDCASCHGPLHGLVPASDPTSPLSPPKMGETCGRCHANPDMFARAGVKLVQPLAAYAGSVHAKAVDRGEKAATCSACHGSHAIYQAADERSQVAHARVPATCGQCHGEITKAYTESVHGKAAASGIREAPVCVDCHGEHRILGPLEAGSPVFATNVPKMTCGRCHGDLRLSEKFGMKSSAVAAFQDSFHGLAGRTGDRTVANCSSCHGVHDILPSADPRSHVSKARLAETCGHCHPGAGSDFAIGAVHVLPEEESQAHPAVYWVRIGYLWLIWLTIGGMALHNLLDLRRKVLAPLPRPVVPLAERRVRLSRGFRLAHGLTALSFIVLAYTGFGLKYPEAAWAAPLLAWEERFGLRGWLHRGAALVMIAAFVFHFVHVAISRRARACIVAMRPTWHDLEELRHKLAWMVGKRQDAPHSPPLGYAEKAEYLALVWGTLVMAVTGFLLWFESFSLSHFPKWVTDVATVVHLYEAILATLAILVWHFYFVIFDPLVYPMDTAWYTGKEAPGRTLERTASVYEPKPRPAKRPEKA